MKGGLQIEDAAEKLINSLQKNNMEKMKNNYVYYDRISDGKSNQGHQKSVMPNSCGKINT